MSLNKMINETNNNSKYELISIHKLPLNIREECYQLLRLEFDIEPEYLFRLVFTLLVLCTILF